MKFFALFLICIVLLFISVGIFDYFKEKTILDYCDQIKLGTTSEEVLKVAKKMKLFVTSSTKIDDDSILVFNQRAPYFRYACDLDFKEMKVVSKSTFMAD